MNLKCWWEYSRKAAIYVLVVLPIACATGRNYSYHSETTADNDTSLVIETESPSYIPLNAPYPHTISFFVADSLGNSLLDPDHPASIRKDIYAEYQGRSFTSKDGVFKKNDSIWYNLQVTDVAPRYRTHSRSRLSFIFFYLSSLDESFTLHFGDAGTYNVHLIVSPTYHYSVYVNEVFCDGSDALFIKIRCGKISFGPLKQEDVLPLDQ